MNSNNILKKAIIFNHRSAREDGSPYTVIVHNWDMDCFINKRHVDAAIARGDIRYDIQLIKGGKRMVKTKCGIYHQAKLYQVGEDTYACFRDNSSFQIDLTTLTEI